METAQLELGQDANPTSLVINAGGRQLESGFEVQSASVQWTATKDLKIAAGQTFRQHSTGGSTIKSTGSINIITQSSGEINDIFFDAADNLKFVEEMFSVSGPDFVLMESNSHLSQTLKDISLNSNEGIDIESFDDFTMTGADLTAQSARFSWLSSAAQTWSGEAGVALKAVRRATFLSAKDLRVCLRPMTALFPLMFIQYSFAAVATGATSWHAGSGWRIYLFQYHC